MKILEIKFQNINNLRGEHHIDFSAEPLSSAGIFAITGPTGSGKSTILDVITLALFNRIPRFQKAISKGEIEGAGSVLTHHTDQAYAQIRYQIKNEVYTSVWSVSKTRTGKLKDYQMILHDQNGTPLDLKKSEVPTKNEEIIGLKYDQYVKSIILSQGEFAKFLKANKNERGQLLENITGSSIYRKLGIAAYQKSKLVSGNIEEEKKLLGVIQVLDQDERKILEQLVGEGQTKKKKMDQELKLLTGKKQRIEELNSLEIKLKAKEEAKTTLLHKIEAFKPELEKLETHEKLGPLQADLALYQEHTENVTISLGNLENNQIKRKAAQAKLDLSIQEMAQLTKVVVVEKNFLDQMKKFEAEVIELDLRIKTIQEKGKETRLRINQNLGRLGTKLDEKVNPNQAIQNLNTYKTQQLVSSEKAGLDSQSDLGLVKEAQKSRHETFHLLERIQHQYHHRKELNDQLEKGQLELEKVKAYLKENQPKVKEYEAWISEWEEGLETLLLLKTESLKVINLEDYRAGLATGEPCPLCGSEAHPYSAHLPKSDLSDLDQKIKEKKNKLGEAKKKQLELSNKLVESNTTLEFIQESNNKNNTKAAEIKNELKLLKEEYKGELSIHEKDIVHSMESVSKKIEDNEKGLEAILELKNIDFLLLEYKQLQLIGKNFQKTRDLRTSKFQGESVTDICNTLQNKFTQSQTGIRTITNILKTNQETLERAKQLSNKLIDKLNPKIRALGFQKLEDTAANLLSQELVTQLKAQHESFKKMSTENDTEISTLSNSLKILKEKTKVEDQDLSGLSTLIQELERERENHLSQLGEAHSQLKRDDQDRAKIQEKEKGISALTAELEKWSFLNKMIGDANGNKFANFAQGLTLQNLLVYANLRLQNLTDRYLLDKPNDDGPLMVIDQYQGNIQRAVTTLSGGESFLISLALALSLSDMASRNVRLESLFIDEGFGTLDQETLDIAMNTLDKLQSESQKMVGVISHVEALKERINVQIQLEKNAQGYSLIKINH